MKRALVTTVTISSGQTYKYLEFWKESLSSQHSSLGFKIEKADRIPVKLEKT